MTTHRTLQCSSCEYILHCIGTCRYSRKLIKYQHTKYKFLTDKLEKKNNSDLDKCQDTKQEGVQGHSWSCPVRISGPDVPLWAGGVCVCVLTKRRKKKSLKKKDRHIYRQAVWGVRHVLLAKPLSKTVIYLASARWWSGYNRPPTPRNDLWPASPSEINSAVPAKSTPRQEGRAGSS